MHPHQSILEFRHSRYFKLFLLLCTSAIAVYAWHEPPATYAKPYGGTWLGYTLGTVAAVLIVWLMLLGIRKRRYASSLGSVQGWTSAHVYLGTSLIVIATLHCGFEFGWNIHTLAYALMMLVVFSGLYGVFSYLRYPVRMTANLAGDTLDSLLEKLNDHDRKCRRIALELPDAFNTLVMNASSAAVGYAKRGRRLWWPGGGRNPVRDARDALLEMGASLEGEQVKRHELLVADMTRLVALTQRVRQELRYRALLRAWLSIHVPLSFGLLAALIAHIVSVFYFW